MKDTRLSINDLPALPRDQDGPVFNQPWEAKAFALAVRLSEAGYFTWPEWVRTFSQEIKAAQAARDLLQSTHIRRTRRFGRRTAESTGAPTPLREWEWPW